MHSADNREISGSNPLIPTSVGSPRVVGSERKGTQILRDQDHSPFQIARMFKEHTEGSQP